MPEDSVHPRTCLSCQFSYPDTLHFCPFCGEPLMDSRSATSSVSGGVPEEDVEGDTSITPGLKIGEYHVQSRLATGGMGVVYAAIHPLIRKRVAIKVLGRRFVADKKAVARFVLEARSVNEIGHHNIVDIFAIGELDDGRNYLVMELIDGVALHELLPAIGCFAPGQILPLYEQLCDALDTTHRKGFVHRDIKPENILVLRRPPYPFIKILDFGLTKLRTKRAELEVDTVAGTVVGTPPYMAPEQCRGEAVDGRTDVYAMGVLLYELLTGKKPFTGTPHEIMVGHLVKTPRPPSALKPGLTPGVDAVVLRMLAKDPAARPATARALFQELKEAVGASLPWPTMPAHLATAVATPTLPPPAAGLPEPIPRAAPKSLEPEQISGASSEIVVLSPSQEGLVSSPSGLEITTRRAPGLEADLPRPATAAALRHVPTRPLPQAVLDNLSDTIRQIQALREGENFDDNPTTVEPWSLGISMNAPEAEAPDTPPPTAEGDPSAYHDALTAHIRRPQNPETLVRPPGRLWLALLTGLVAGFAVATAFWAYFR